MVRMAHQQGSGDLFSSGDVGAGVALVDDMDHKASKEIRQSSDSDEVKKEPGPSDSHDPAPAGGDADADIDDDVAMTFPQRLMEVLDEPENADVLSWLHHGRGFVIYRKKAFEQRLLPRYFGKQSKYSSFTRKLNRWGFSRVTRGPEAGAYYHPCFQRGGHRLVMQMSCQSSNKGPADASALNKGANLGMGAASTTPFSGIMPGMSPAPSTNFALSSLALEHLGLPQQQQQLLQLQLQQQLFQQEAMCRALLASTPSISGIQSIQAGIPPVSMHSLSQQEHQYSQLLAAHLAQRGYGAASASSSTQLLFPVGDAKVRGDAADGDRSSQGLGADVATASQPQPPPA